MADTMRLAGALSFTIDGASFNISGECAYTPSSVSRQTLKGQNGVHGYSEVEEPGKISFKGRDASDVQIKSLNEATNVTVVAALANGKTIIGRNMWRVGEPIEVNTEDATFTADFEGPDVTEN